MVQFRQPFLFIMLSVAVTSGLGAAKTMAKPKAQAQEIELDGVYRWLKQSFSGIASSPTSLDGLEQQFFTKPEIIAMEEAINAAVDHKVKVDDPANYQVQAAHTQDSIKKRYNEAFAKNVRTKADRMLLVYDLFAKQKPLSWDDSAQAKISQHSFEDLDFFATAKNFHSILFNQATVHTLAGRARMAYEMANPTTDIAVIKQKQQLVKWLLDNPETFEKLDQLLAKIKQAEESWLDLWSSKTEVDLYKKHFGSPKERAQEKMKFSPADWETSWKTIGLSALDKGLSGLSHFIVQAFFFGVKEPLMLINTSVVPMVKPLSMVIEKIFEKHDWALLSKATLWPTFVTNFVMLFVVCVHTAKYKRAGIMQAFQEFSRGMSPDGATRGQGNFVQSYFNNVKKFALNNPKEMQVFINVVLNIANPLVELALQKEKFKTLSNGQRTLCGIRQLVTHLNALNNIQALGAVMPAFKELNVFLAGNNDADLKDLLKRLNSGSFDRPAGPVFHYGKTIRSFILLRDKKAQFAKAMEVVGLIDGFMGVAKLIKKGSAQKNGFCFPQVVKHSAPIFAGQKMWSPVVGAELAVPNNLVVGKGVGQHCGALVSGPNYGGKSVFLRNSIINALLTQSLGIAAAESLTITPFKYLDTYSMVPDSTADQESRFSAELARIEILLNTVKTAEQNNEFVMFVGDELLTGTSGQYAQALIRALFKKLATVKHGVFIFATHFKQVIQAVVAETNHAFEQLKVDSLVNEDGFYKAPTFKVMPGTSAVDSAIFVAERKLALNPDLVADAKDILLTER